MKNFWIAFLFLSIGLNAQDKLFFNNGKMQEGRLISIGKDLIFFKTSDTSIVQRIAKKDLMLVEELTGIRHVFAMENSSVQEPSLQPKSISRHSFGIQPLSIFIGRGTVVYEHLTEKGNIGLAVPLSLTFDVLNLFNFSSTDSTFQNLNPSKQLNFVGGLDVNFYLGKNENAQFFIGPKLRYGTDVTFGNIEHYTVQTQLGWKFGNPEGKFLHHLGMSYGIVHVISSKLPRLGLQKNYFSVYNFSYRLSVKW